MGGWPVIENEWKKPKFSKEQLFGRLRGDYSESVLIELFVGADDKNSSVNIIQVGGADLDVAIVVIHFAFLLNLYLLPVGPIGFGTTVAGLLFKGEQRGGPSGVPQVHGSDSGAARRQPNEGREGATGRRQIRNAIGKRNFSLSLIENKI